MISAQQTSEKLKVAINLNLKSLKVEERPLKQNSFKLSFESRSVHDLIFVWKWWNHESCSRLLVVFMSPRTGGVFGGGLGPHIQTDQNAKSSICLHVWSTLFACYITLKRVLLACNRNKVCTRWLSVLFHIRTVGGAETRWGRSPHYFLGNGCIILSFLYFGWVLFQASQWAPAGFFSRGGQIRGLETKVPQRGWRMKPRCGSGGKAKNRSRRQVLKIMHE